MTITVPIQFTVRILDHTLGTKEAIINLGYGEADATNDRRWGSAILHSDGTIHFLPLHEWRFFTPAMRVEIEKILRNYPDVPQE